MRMASNAVTQWTINHETLEGGGGQFSCYYLLHRAMRGEGGSKVFEMKEPENYIL